MRRVPLVLVFLMLASCKGCTETIVEKGVQVSKETAKGIEEKLGKLRVYGLELDLANKAAPR